MQKFLFLFYVLFILFSCKDTVETVDCLPPNLQQDVIAFYPFKNGSLLDESSNGNHLTNTTSAKPSSDRGGNANCAFLFDVNKKEFLTTQDTKFLNGLSSFSVSLWYQAQDTTRNAGVYESLLSRGEGQSCPDKIGEWAVGLYDCRRAVFGHNNSVWAKPFKSCFGDLKWHHVVAVKDNNTYKIYFDGNLHESQNGNGGCPSGSSAKDQGDMFIGKLSNTKIDDIIIYKRALNDSEAKALFDVQPCCN